MSLPIQAELGLLTIGITDKRTILEKCTRLLLAFVESIKSSGSSGYRFSIISTWQKKDNVVWSRVRQTNTTNRLDIAEVSLTKA